MSPQAVRRILRKLSCLPTTSPYAKILGARFTHVMQRSLLCALACTCCQGTAEQADAWGGCFLPQGVSMCDSSGETTCFPEAMPSSSSSSTSSFGTIPCCASLPSVGHQQGFPEMVRQLAMKYRSQTCMLPSKHSTCQLHLSHQCFVPTLARTITHRILPPLKMLLNIPWLLSPTSFLS